MKRIYVLSLLFVTLSFMKAQTTNFQKLYGDTITEDGFSICRSNQDNAYVYTGQALYANYQMLIVKTNQFGDTLWTKTIDNANGSQGRSIIQTKDSGYVVLGTANMITGNDIFIVKLDKNGQTLWSKMYDNAGNSDYGRTVIEDPTGNLYVGGHTTPGNVYPLIMKLNKNGNIKWAKVYGSAYNRRVESLDLSADGALVAAGTTEDSLTISTDPLVFKVDTANGNFYWAKMHIGSSGSTFYSVITNSNNDIIAAGGTQDYNSSGALRSAIVARFNSNGSLQQFKSYSDCAFSTVIAYQIIHDANLGYALTGFAMPCPLSSLNSFLIRLDAGTNVLSHSFFGTTTSTVSGWELTREPNDGGYVIVGSEINSSASPVNSDAAIVRATASGITSCNTFTSAITGAAFTPTFIAASFSVTGGITSTTFIPTYTKGLKITTQCVTVGLDRKEEQKLDIHSWPNPFKNEFFVNVPLEEITLATLYDITGKKINATFEPVNKGFKVKGQFTNGIYLLSIEKKDHSSQTIRVNCLGN